MKIYVLSEGRQQMMASAYSKIVQKRLASVYEELDVVQTALFAHEGVEVPEHMPIETVYLKRDPKTRKYSLKTQWQKGPAKMMGGIVFRHIDHVEPETKISPDNPHIPRWLELENEAGYWNDKLYELTLAMDFDIKNDFPLEIDERGNMIYGDGPQANYMQNVQ